MDENTSPGTRVKLVSFHGETSPSEPVLPEENFWLLVGKEGEVASDNVKAHPAFPDKGGRALVTFDESLSGLGLESHNDVANSLWIFLSDLEVV